MTPILTHLWLSRDALRRKDYIPFLRALVPRHPELRRPVEWDGFIRMTQRESITVRVLPMPTGEQGQLMRVGRRAFIQINEDVPKRKRAEVGVHELVHFWRDDPGTPVYHSEEEWAPSQLEDFANSFAWMVCSPHRDIVGTREEDLQNL